MAPSPTGPFHIGSARTALFNYLFAKKYGGQFILRIEDTDLERSKPEWEEDIKESLRWLGLDYDEGPDKGGEFGPYRQSERKNIYQRYLEKLLAEKNAYWCFCREEEVEAYKQYQLSIGRPPIFNCKCSEILEEQTNERLRSNESAVIRFKIPHRQITFADLLKGEIEYDSSLFGDMVVAKNITEPLYNLACVIDDFEMKITHVIRGEEHLPNTPRQILLAEALGVEPPRFLHLPLILNQQRAKLSKRDPLIVAKVGDYKKLGYLAEALVNFIALLGWSPGDNREIFLLPELAKEFSVEKIQKSGAVFNLQKLDWINGYYIRRKSLGDLTKICLPYLIDGGLVVASGEQEYRIVQTGEEIPLSRLEKIIALYQERLKKLSEITELSAYFFKAELEYPRELLRWNDMTEKEILAVLKKLEKVLQKVKDDEWTRLSLEKLLLAEAERIGDRGKLLWPMRAALSGSKASPSPFDIADVLGQEKTLQRVKKAAGLIKS